MDGEDIPGAIGSRLNLLSQCGDVRIYGAGSGHCVVTPDFVQELIPRENRAAILNQVAKQSYLARLQFNYDNSADNPRNPASPPKRVHWGEGSNDEMGSMSLLVVAANESELPELQQAYRRHVRSAFMAPGGLEFLRRRGR